MMYNLTVYPTLADRRISTDLSSDSFNVYYHVLGWGSGRDTQRQDEHTGAAGNGMKDRILLLRTVWTLSHEHGNI